MTEIAVPATLYATIAARIDHLEPDAKQTLNAAAVIGSRFTPELLTAVGNEPVIDALVSAELIDRIRFTPSAEYAFRHPLIRAVAYESQLKADRAQLHRRLAEAIQMRDPVSLDENAALIGAHLEAAGDLRAAFNWHMRAGAWSFTRDIAAARVSWQHGRSVADGMPGDHPKRLSMRIVPRTLLCASAFRVGGSGADTGFDELRDLCAEAGDLRSMALGMAGLVLTQWANARPEASRLATELMALLDTVGDPTLTVTLSFSAMIAKHETGEIAEILRLAQRVIDLAEGDPARGNLFIGSPLAVALAMRGEARCCLGLPGWKSDFTQAAAMARAADPISLALALLYTYVLAIPNGVLLPDAAALRETEAALAIAQRSGDEIVLHIVGLARGITLAHRDGPERDAGLVLLAQLREAAFRERFTLQVVPLIDIHLAQEKARSGDLDGAIGLARSVFENLLTSGRSTWSALATTALVEALLGRAGDGDLKNARAAIDRLATEPADPGFVLNEITLLRLRALVAHARGDEIGYSDYRDRYRALATSLGFEGHMKWAEAMP